MDRCRRTLAIVINHLPSIHFANTVQILALEQAYEYWEKFQFDIIAAKVSKLTVCLDRHFC